MYYSHICSSLSIPSSVPSWCLISSTILSTIFLSDYLPVVALCSDVSMSFSSLYESVGLVLFFALFYNSLAFIAYIDVFDVKAPRLLSPLSKNYFCYSISSALFNIANLFFALPLFLISIFFNKFFICSASFLSLHVFNSFFSLSLSFSSNNSSAYPADLSPS